MSTSLERIAAKARKEGNLRFSNLVHHIDSERLRRELAKTPLRTSCGVDWKNKQDSLQGAEEWAADVLAAIHGRGYKAPPVRRVLIPKAEKSSFRPIGIPTIRDRAVQRSVSEVLGAIFEQDFLSTSFGGRPRVGAHHAIATFHQTCTRKKVEWVFEADLKNFFGSLDHSRLMRFVKHRINDPRILNLIYRWLKAGILNGDRIDANTDGVPQGGPISVLLSNIYLHYVLDLWVEKIVKPRMRGEIYFVRYLDDFLVCFQFKEDAVRFQKGLVSRLARFSLTLEESKTGLVRFGRNARSFVAKGEKPKTVYFLGFTFYVGKTLKGFHKIGIRTEKSRRQRCKRRVTELIRSLMHSGIREQYRRISEVIRGMFRYYGIFDNSRSNCNLRDFTLRTWRKWLCRRSQKGRYTWERFSKTKEYFALPLPRVYIKFPDLEKLAVL